MQECKYNLMLKSIAHIFFSNLAITLSKACILVIGHLINGLYILTHNVQWFIASVGQYTRETM